MNTQASNTYDVYARSGSARREMLDFVPPDSSRVLDVGCSIGEFGEQLKRERSVEVWGVEPDPEAAAIAATKLDRVVTGTFDAEEFSGPIEFDCIVFNDVLEHMVDPYSALGSARRLLSPRGIIVASIPNVRYFDNVWKLVFNASWEYTDIGILDRTHLRFFTKSTIVRMFEDQGYRIDRIEGINAVDWCNPERRQLFRWLNFLMRNRLDGMRWMQFAVVARPAS